MRFLTVLLLLCAASLNGAANIARLDVVLVIDRSESMLGTPYAGARTAATNFFRNLNLGTNADLAGLASFNRTSTLNHVLSPNGYTVEAAVSALPAAHAGTCISCGLTNAQAELVSIRHRVGAMPVMVLLTDGVPKLADGDSPSNALYYAQQARLAGTRLFTVGLNDGTGTNVDIPLLMAMASSPQDFFYAANGAELQGILDQIAFVLHMPTSNNLWPNSTLELDSNGDGIPDFWNKRGSDPSLDFWDTNSFVSGSHALAVRDANPNGYGGWFSDSIPVAPGDRYVLSFKRRYCSSGAGMRVSARFISSSNTFVSSVDFPVSGCQLVWEQVAKALLIPAGIAKLNLEIVSGGGVGETGTNWIDDISLSAIPTNAPANLWPNSTLELDSNADGIPDFWYRGGSNPTFDIWETNTAVSGSHSLAVTDASAVDYGEWYSDFFPVVPGDRFIWAFQRQYDGGTGMRANAKYWTITNTYISEMNFPVSGSQLSWESVVSELLVPPGAAKLQITINTGLPETGTNWIDDISLTAVQAVTLISTGSVWRYLENGSDQGTNWIRKNFDDTSWRSGPAQLGYGDGDEATLVSYGPDPNDKYITTYFRHSFAVQDASLFTNLNIRLLRDDGAVVYLNGEEIWRSNMPTNETIQFMTRASSAVGGTDEATFRSFITNASLLANGLNVLAVEIHQVNNTNSSDISFDLELSGNVNFPPVVNITLPTNDAVFLAPATVAIEAAAFDPEGALSKVEFFRGRTKLGEATNSPYALIWSNVPVGDYGLTAVATDAGGVQTTSSVISVTVNKDTLYSVISTGAVWKYLADGSDQGTNWTSNTFDDAAWLSGPAQLGYGDGDEATVVGFGSEPTNKFITTYFRRAFVVEDTSTFGALILRVLRDDGAVVYLNGTEVFRSNMPTGSISYLTLATLVGGNAPEENKFYVTSLQPGVLRSGTNLIAVEVHQGRVTSTDVSFDLALGVTELNNAPRIFVNGIFDPVANHVATNTAQVALQTSYPGGTIFYSLDGSPPSILYTHSFVLGQSAVVRAIAYNSNFVESSESGPVQVTLFNAYLLSATTSGGGSVTLDQTNTLYLSGTTVQLHATPASGWTFLGWKGDAVGTNQTFPLTMTQNRCVEAVFGTAVGISVVGSGSIAVNLQPVYPHGFPMRLTAVPQAGNYFAFWGNAATGTNNPLVFAVTNPNPTVTAVFASLGVNQFTLTVVPDGRGQVTVSPRAAFYPSGQTVTLTAQPEAGQAFNGWSGSASGSQNPLVVPMNQSKVVTANFSSRPRFATFQCEGHPSSDEFQLLLTGELGAAYQIDGSVNLTNWTALATLTNVMGTVQFNDSSITNLSHRFFRATRTP